MLSFSELLGYLQDGHNVVTMTQQLHLDPTASGGVLWFPHYKPKTCPPASSQHGLFSKILLQTFHSMRVGCPHRLMPVA